MRPSDEPCIMFFDEHDLELNSLDEDGKATFYCHRCDKIYDNQYDPSGGEQ